MSIFILRKQHVMLCKIISITYADKHLGLGLNREKALDTLTEIYNVYRDVFGKSIVLRKDALTKEYVIVLQDSLTNFSRDLIQPVLHKNKLAMKETKDFVTIYSI